MTDDTQRVFVVKFALSKGILEVDAVITDRDFAVFPDPDFGHSVIIESRYWYSDRAEAVAYAETMRARRIVFLEKQLALARSVNFQNVTVLSKSERGRT